MGQAQPMESKEVLWKEESQGVPDAGTSPPKALADSYTVSARADGRPFKRTELRFELLPERQSLNLSPPN